MHPWALRAPPADLPDHVVAVAVVVADWHARWPWSAARWGFVGRLQRALTPLRWWGTSDALMEALAGAHRVHAVDDPHPRQALGTVSVPIDWRPAPRLFAPVAARCNSFSQWWRRTRLAP